MTDEERDINLMSKRFPALEQAKAEFIGQKRETSPKKKIHAEELVNFSKAVYELSQENEPHRSRKCAGSTAYVRLCVAM